MKKRTENIKAIAGLFLLGLLLAIASQMGSIPSSSDLVPITGKLISLTGRKGLLLLELEGSEKKFGYASEGQLCGAMYEKLSSIKGKGITLYYDPHVTKPIISQEFNKIYEFRIDGVDICTYAEILDMHEGQKSWGLYGGLCMIFLSLIGLLELMSVTNAAQKSEFQFNRDESEAFTRKLEAEERERRALEEGERIISDQWKS